MPDLSFRVEMAGDVPVVVTPEDIDITNAAAFRTALLEAAGRSRTFVVDMSRTQFCDTACLCAATSAWMPEATAAAYGWSSPARPCCASSRSPASTR